MHEKVGASDRFGTVLSAAGGNLDLLRAKGRFKAVFREAGGRIMRSVEFDNILTQIGKALILDQGLAGSSYTALDYMGLISSVSYTGLSGGDTMTAHVGWAEAGGSNAPTYSGTRLTCGWGASTLSGSPNYQATKTLSAGLMFTFTGSGTVTGAFIVAGSGAGASIGDTGGILYAEGAFTTPQPVIATNTLTVSYSVTLT